MQIFTADEPEVEALPRKAVVEFLAKENKDACVVYLEHAIQTLEENGAEFHDRLAELYLDKAKKDETTQKKLLEFLDTSQHYRANRLLGRIKGEGRPNSSDNVRSAPLTNQTCHGSRLCS